MKKQKAQFERIVRNTCRNALSSYRERPDLFRDTDSGLHLTFRMLKETAPECGYDNDEFTSLIEPELHCYLD